VWSNTNLIISNTYNTGSILGAGWFGGGLIGQVWSYYIEQAQVSIDNSNSTGLIDGLDSPDSANGGLIGGVEYSSNLTVTNSTWSVPLTGQTNCYTFVNAPGCESGCSIDSNEGCTAQ
jgi:hypothetical protein